MPGRTGRAAGRGPVPRAAGPAAIGYAVASLAAAALEAIVLDLAVVTPAELVADVTARQVPWVLAQVLYIVQQPLLIVVVLGLWAITPDGPRPQLIVGTVMLAFSGLLFTLSGIFHGVFGWHVAAVRPSGGQDGPVAAPLAEILHALGDTSFYIAIAATAVAMIAWLPVLRRNSVAAGGLLPVGLRRLAIVAVVLQLVEFGYFLLPGLAYAAPVGIACQAAWYVWLGRILSRAAH